MGFGTILEIHNDSKERNAFKLIDYSLWILEGMNG